MPKKVPLRRLWTKTLEFRGPSNGINPVLMVMGGFSSVAQKHQAFPQALGVPRVSSPPVAPPPAGADWPPTQLDPWNAECVQEQPAIH